MIGFHYTSLPGPVSQEYDNISELWGAATMRNHGFSWLSLIRCVHYLGAFDDGHEMRDTRRCQRQQVSTSSSTAQTKPAKKTTSIFLETAGQILCPVAACL